MQVTDVFTAILDRLWVGSAIDAAALLRQLADGMERLHIENDGAQYAPDLTEAIEASEVYKWMQQDEKERREAIEGAIEDDPGEEGEQDIDAEVEEIESIERELNPETEECAPTAEAVRLIQGGDPWETEKQPTQLILKLRRIDDEYVVQWWENGVYKEGPTYYTDDVDDARLTQEAMRDSAKKRGMIVRCTG